MPSRCMTRAICVGLSAITDTTLSVKPAFVEHRRIDDGDSCPLCAALIKPFFRRLPYVQKSYRIKHPVLVVIGESEVRQRLSVDFTVLPEDPRTECGNKVIVTRLSLHVNVPAHPVGVKARYPGFNKYLRNIALSAPGTACKSNSKHSTFRISAGFRRGGRHHQLIFSSRPRFAADLCAHSMIC